MLLSKPRKKNKAKLLGAVRINNTSFFVCKNTEGRVCLECGKEEKLQKAILQRMIDLNPSIKRILNDYKIKPVIDTKTLRELAGGHMNETCKVALGIYSLLSDTLKSNVCEKSIKASKT